MQLLRTIRAHNTLGESVLWDGQSQTLWWTDIQERTLLRFDWSRQSLVHIGLPERLGSFGFAGDAQGLVAAFETGFAVVEAGTHAIRWLARIPGIGDGIRFNDGRVDRQGRFWAGTMAENPQNAGKATLYCLPPGREPMAREGGLTITNGLCWNPDGTTMYLADSAQHVIWRYDFDPESGAIANRRIFARTADDVCPDGATVDADGFVWSAHWGAGRVVRYTPDGEIESVLDVPASQPTCVAFGGPDMNLLFVTSAREGLSEETLQSQPNAGDVFVYETPWRGLPEPRFRLETAQA